MQDVQEISVKFTNLFKCMTHFVVNIFIQRMLRIFFLRISDILQFKIVTKNNLCFLVLWLTVKFRFFCILILKNNFKNIKNIDTTLIKFSFFASQKKNKRKKRRIKTHLIHMGQYSLLATLSCSFSY